MGGGLLTTDDYLSNKVYSLTRLLFVRVKLKQQKLMTYMMMTLHYPNIEDMPDVTSVDKIVEVKRVS